MTHYNTLNVKLSNKELNKESNLISNYETNFPHKLLWTNTQVSKIRKAFANGSSANTKFAKPQLSKMMLSAVA